MNTEAQTQTETPNEQPSSGDAERKPRRKRRDSRGNSRKKSWSPSEFVVPAVADKKRFHDFNLPDDLMHAIADLGFEYCTPIQAATIEQALEGKDLIAKAQTGTGKTASFLMGIITDLLDFPLPKPRKLAEPRALIIAPTRELALQIAADAEGLVRYAGMSVVSLVGGMDFDKQRKALAKAPVDILVATPGRLIDFVRSKDVDLYHVEVLVLDEADRMLSMGFIPDVRTIIRHTPRKGPERQTLLYSATFSEEIMQLARQWTVDPVQIEIESESQVTDNISQKVFLVSAADKFKLLRNYLRINNVERAIVFCNRRHEARDLAEKLRRDGVKSALMSGEIPQNKRMKTMDDFRSGKIEVLVATDVAGRGIHIDGVSHVINYQLPEDPDDYVHRIGRTGRAGASGTSIAFACENDSFMIPEVEAGTGVKLECIHPDAALLEDLSAHPPQAESAAQAQDDTPEDVVIAEEVQAPTQELIEEPAQKPGQVLKSEQPEQRDLLTEADSQSATDEAELQQKKPD
ncbi:ATP-dependent RNA helicase RhlB [Nitrincola sp.]|uniref:ATP-dependent RNA helicase RhlB n=1 Tax=Nitrincola sp. TaxID=1926584 RepID=UPI003A92DD7E